MSNMVDDKLFDVTTPDDLSTFMDNWEKATSTVNELAVSVKAHIGYIDSHFTAKTKKADQERKEQARRQQTEALKKVREDAKAAADLIRQKSTPVTTTKVVPPICLANHEKYTGVAA